MRQEKEAALRKEREEALKKAENQMTDLERLDAQRGILMEVDSRRCRTFTGVVPAGNSRNR